MLFGLGKNKSKTEKSGDNTRRDDARQTVSGSGVRKPRLRGAAALKVGVNKLFHGVAVRPRSEACCQAVKSLGTQRFLSEDAPLLPLADCSNPQGCRCVYEHFDERRDNLRRETDIGMPERLYPEEKRAGHGRRITDG